jgi:hypothetical protein
MIAYLDTTVFDHLYKKIGCTSTDIANLRTAIYGRRLSIPLSIHTLEEMLLARKARPELLVAQVKLTLSLASFRRLVKPCDQLLADDIRAYAARGEADRPYVGADLQNVLSDGIGELIETDGEDLDEDMVAALAQTRHRKERFQERMRLAQEEVLAAVQPSSGQITFMQYFRETTPLLAERFAHEASALDGCRERGIDGLAGIKSVRMAIGSASSFVFGQGFEGWPMQPGDASDLLHAVSAAAVADTFVTDDKRLRTALARVPLDGFEVLDLAIFLQRLH